MRFLVTRAVLVRALLLSVLCVGAPAVRSECVDYSTYLHLSGLLALPESPNSVVMAGSFAFTIGYSTGLYVIDVSDMSTPQLAASLSLPYGNRDLAIEGNFAFVAGDSHGVWVIDISDPLHPVLVSHCATSEPANAIAVAGDIACVVMSYDKLGTIDISDPLNPRPLGTLALSGFVQDVVLVGTTAYAASTSGLRIIDVALPERPRRVDVIESGFGGNAVEVRDGYAYVAAGQYGLRILDISNAQYPQPISIFPVPAGATAVAIAGSCVFVLDQYRGLVAVDVSNVAYPVLAAGFPTLSDARGIAAAGHHILVGSGRNLEIVDVANVRNPVAEGSIVTGWTSDCRVTDDGGLAFLAQDTGVTIVELTASGGPGLLRHVGLPSFAKAIAMAGRYVYVADYQGGLQVIDAGDPTNAHVIGSTATSGYAFDVAVAGTIACVAARGYGVEIIDVSDPERPRVVGAYRRGDVEGVALRGTTLLVTLYQMGPYADSSEIAVVDVSNPQNPRRIAGLTLPGSVAPIAVSGDYAYVASYPDGLQVIDISNIAAPTSVGHAGMLANSATCVVVTGTTAVVGGSTSGLEIFDISQPANPVEVGLCGAGFGFLCADIVGDTVFAAGYVSTGFQWFGLPCDSEPVAGVDGPVVEDCGLRAYPNPAFSTVTLSSGCEKSQIRRVEVFDLSGRRLRLIEADTPGGAASSEHWNGRDDDGVAVASGNYIIRAATSAGVRTTRIALIR